MRVYTIDYETFWSTEYTLSKMSTEEYVRDPRYKTHMVGVKLNDGQTVVLNDSQFRAALDRGLRKKLQESAVLCQNTTFDGFILMHHYGVIPAFYLDTMSMFRALFPDKRASLKVISETLHLPKKGGDSGYDVVNTRGVETLDPYQFKACAEYCASDCDIAYRAYKLMAPYTPLFELKLINQTIRFYTQPILRLNPTPLQAEIEAEVERKEQLMARIAHQKESLMSNQKFAALLESYGVTPPIKPSPTALKKDPSLKRIVDQLEAEEYNIATFEEWEIPWTFAFGKADSAMKALQQHDNPDVQALTAARVGMKSTLAETRARKFLAAAERGAFPVGLNYAAAHTLRWGGRDGNVQNLPRNSRLREAFEAPEGYVLCVSDLAGIEARVLPYLAGQEDVMTLHRNGDDLYCDMASAVYQRRITKKDKDERQVGKVLVLSSGYGMSWQKFAINMYLVNKTIFGADMADTLGVNLDFFESKEYSKFRKAKPFTLTDEQYIVHGAVSQYLSKVYRDKNYNIVKFWKHCDSVLHALVDKREMQVDCKGIITAKDSGLFTSVGGAIRYRDLRRDQVGKRVEFTRAVKEGRAHLHGSIVVENVVQWLSRHILAEQALVLQAEGLKIAFTCHDEIVGVVPESEAAYWKRRMVEVMSTSPAWAPDLPLGAESGVGKNYNEAK